VASSWTMFRSKCKSRLSAFARSVYEGRKFWREKCREARRCVQETRQEMAKLESALAQLEGENARLRVQVGELEAQVAQPQPVKLPLGNVPRGQQYGTGLVELCVNVACAIGLRPTCRVLDIVFDWLGAEVKLPTYQTIGTWMQRIGLDRMQNAKNVAGGAWLVDHTNQIGKEKVLVVLRVRETKLSRWRGPLRHQDVEVLTVMPGEAWKREDMANTYQELVKRYGLPRSVGSDGAIELREPAETLGTPKKRPLVIRDAKHLLANKFENLLCADSHYPSFSKQVGGMRSALQQTELVRFIPPPFKPKARFMNLEPILHWAQMVLWHLDHPESDSRQGITDSRFEEKLGWVREFASHIPRWQTSQQVISTSLAFINQHGIFSGAADQCQQLLAHIEPHAMSQRLADTIIESLRKYERQLRPKERLPMSTEILESSFALFKQLEKQHSKSGFTGLILTFPTLLRKTTSKEVAASFRRVKVADVRQWTKQHLNSTVTAQRQHVYREAKQKAKNRATPSMAAA
jgi:hypothetical protein